MGIALFHLLLMALGASGLGYSWLGPLKSPLTYYGALSGAGDGYGFFAPGISGQLRARFEIVDHEGVPQTVRLETGASHEADLRVGNIIDQFTEDFVDPDLLQRSLAASLAGTIFGRYPRAERVVVHLENFTPVSMVDYRQGLRAHWDPVYQASFALKRRRRVQ